MGAALNEERAEASGVGAAAMLLAASVLLSRVLGYAREALLAHLVGAGASSDAYYAAFQIPDLMNYLLAGGALSIALLPLYTRRFAQGQTDAAERLLGVVLGTVGAITTVLTLALWWFAEPLVALQFPRFDPATQALTVRLTRIVLPAQFFFLTGGIINTGLLARGRFAASALAPLIYNGGIIAGGMLLTGRLEAQVEGFSWGALAGAIAGPFLVPLLDSRGRIRIRPRLAPLEPAFVEYLLVALPLMLGQTLLTVDEWYERWFGALLAAGTVAHLSYARKLMLVPVAVVGQAASAAALPALSRLWAENRVDELDRLVLRTLQAGLALAILGAGAFCVLSHEIVGVIYEHGRFGAADTATVGGILSILSLAVPAWIVQQIVARAFYARGDTWRPMLLGSLIALGAIPVYLVFGRRFGVGGLAAAGALGMSVNALATILLARRLHGAPDLRRLGATGLRMLLVAAAAALVALLGKSAVPSLGVSLALERLAVGLVLFGAVSLAGFLALGGEVAVDLVARVRARLGRRP